MKFISGSNGKFAKTATSLAHNNLAMGIVATTVIGATITIAVVLSNGDVSEKQKSPALPTNSPSITANNREYMQNMDDSDELGTTPEETDGESVPHQNNNDGDRHGNIADGLAPNATPSATQSPSVQTPMPTSTAPPSATGNPTPTLSTPSPTMPTGNPTLTPVPELLNVTYEYDNLGRITKVIYDTDNYITYAYDANGNIIKVTTVKDGVAQ